MNETTNTGTTNETSDGEAAPPREAPEFLRASFALEVVREDESASVMADATVNLRMPSSAACEAVLPVLTSLLPLLAERLGVSCSFATGGAHVAGCGKGKATPPDFDLLGARVLVLVCEDASLVGRKATVVARDPTRKPIEPGTTYPPGRYEWLCDVDGFRPSSPSTGPWFRTADLAPIAEVRPVG